MSDVRFLQEKDLQLHNKFIELFEVYLFQLFCSLENMGVFRKMCYFYMYRIQM